MTLRVCGGVLWCALVVFLGLAVVVQAADDSPDRQVELTAAGSYTITDLKTEKSAQGVKLRVICSEQPTFTMYELFNPGRIVLDLAAAGFAETVQLPIKVNQGPVTSITGTILDDNTPAIVRLEIFLSGDQPYAAERQGNEIVVVFQEQVGPSGVGDQQPVAVGDPVEEPSAAPESEQPMVTEEPQTVLEESSPAIVMGSEPSDPSLTGLEEISDKEDSAVQEPFKLAGYDRQEITVDFYKIDLHNVFRLFGEISGMNIVITEGVSGTLTLALNKVPWDFALDLILNLKQLQKIERHGTLIIATKGVDFSFGEQPADNLEVKTSNQLLVKKGAPEVKPAPQVPAAERSEDQPDGDRQEIARVEESRQVVEAKKIMVTARKHEKSGEYDQALTLYEEAFEKWPANKRLAHRLASLFLVHKGMNAKAVHYAKQALKLDPTDRPAALYAAIGLANMKRARAALEFFEMAVQDNGTLGPPAGEALASYAAFNEENGDYVSALLLLARHEELYGETIDTMVAKARIYDKEGNGAKAVAQYRAILLSGYALPPDLNRYIKGRLALDDTTNKEK